MESKIKIHQYLWVLFFILSRPIFAQMAEKGISSFDYKPITLKAAIQQGIQKNHGIGVRDHERGVLNLTWEGQWAAFWLPNINISLNVDPHRIMRIRNSTNLVGHQSKHAGGDLALNFGEYTVFNWGKDYLAFLNNKQNFTRGLQELTEADRQLKFDIITSYSNLLTLYEILKSQRVFLRHSSYVYKLTKEKIAAKKISGQEYYQTRVLYLEAYQNYLEAKREWIAENEKLAFLIDDEPSTRYILGEELRLVKLDKSLNSLVEIGKKNAPQVMSAYSQKKIAERNYEIAKRENMALPAFKINLGAFTQSWDTGSNNQLFSNYEGNRNLEIIASLTATWNIVGTDGFLNKRKLDIAQLNRRISDRTLKQQEDYMLYLTTNYFHQIKNLEKQNEISDERNKTSESAYNITFNNYTLRKTSFLNFLHSLKDLTDSKVINFKNKRDHLLKKVQLSSVIGVADLPGNLFENHVAKLETVTAEETPQELAPEEIEEDPYYQGEE